MSNFSGGFFLKKNLIEGFLDFIKLYRLLSNNILLESVEF